MSFKFSLKILVLSAVYGTTKTRMDYWNSGHGWVHRAGYKLNIFYVFRSSFRLIKEKKIMVFAFLLIFLSWHWKWWKSKYENGILLLNMPIRMQSLRWRIFLFKKSIPKISLHRGPAEWNRFLSQIYLSEALYPFVQYNLYK